MTSNAAKEAKRRYRERNREKIRLASRTPKSREASRERYRRNKLAILTSAKEWRRKNKDKAAAINKRKYEKNKSAYLAQQKEYYARNRPRIEAYRRTEKVRAKLREYEANNREARNAQKRSQDPEKKYAAVQRYIKKNPQRKRHWDATRRARRKGAEGSHTHEQWLAKVAAYGSKCAYCGEEKTLTRDHDIPLSRGGSHSIDNLVPACKSCNSRKRAMTGVEFMQKLQGA